MDNKNERLIQLSEKCDSHEYNYILTDAFIILIVKCYTGFLSLDSKQIEGLFQET